MLHCYLHFLALILPVEDHHHYKKQQPNLPHKRNFEQQITDILPHSTDPASNILPQWSRFPVNNQPVMEMSLNKFFIRKYSKMPLLPQKNDAYFELCENPNA
jgi:hypothetical protein